MVSPLLIGYRSAPDSVRAVYAPALSAGHHPLSPNGCKVYTDEIYMYGLGGPNDGLTHVFVTLDFCYNGSTATANQITGYCAGDDIGLWRWVVDRCNWADYNVGPATYVWGTLQGNFHCDPITQFPCSQKNGYYHWIQNKLQGAYNGAVNCYFGYGGDIVSGVRKAQAC